MCYYNGQKITREEAIILNQLKKRASEYDFLQRDLQIGFDYSLNAVFSSATRTASSSLSSSASSMVRDSYGNTKNIMQSGYEGKGNDYFKDKISGK